MVAAVPPDFRATSVEAAVRPVIEENGLFLEEVRVRGTDPRTHVQVTVDLPADAVGALDADSLAEVSRLISRAMDDADPVAGRYTLEISTPGVSRPLTEPHHYSRARGRLIKVRLSDGSSTIGRVASVDDDSVTVVTEDASEVRMVFDSIAKARVQVELNRVEEVDIDAAIKED